MGALRSKTNYEGLIVNNITLGQPTILTDTLTPPNTIMEAWFVWDDSALPNGIIVDGEIFVEEGL